MQRGAGIKLCFFVDIYSPSKSTFAEWLWETKKKRECLGFFSEAAVFTLLCFTVDFFWKNNHFFQCHTERTQSSVFIELKNYILRSVTEERRFVSVYWIQVLLSRTLQRDQDKKPHDTLRIKCGTTDERSPFQLKTPTNCIILYLCLYKCAMRNISIK